MKKILFANIGEIKDRKTWSGIPFSIYNELKRYYKVDTLSIKMPKQLEIYFKIKAKIIKFFKKKNIIQSHSIIFAKYASKELQKYIANGDYDCIFTIGCAQIAYVKTDIPIVYFADAVVSNMIDYYWFDVDKKSLKEANYIQKKALERINKICLASNWAKQAAIRDYSIESEKIEILHMGSNIEINTFNHIDHEGINLLFVGVDWKRKGGDIAIECVRKLTEKDKNNKYILHLVGCNPPYEIKDNNIKVYGFINRNIKEEREKLDHLREISDIFILPTRAECAGIVFCEACAYSLPSITYSTGGTPDYVINGENGYAIPLNQTGENFADTIIKIINEKSKLESMKNKARKMYEQDLNWQNFGERLSIIIEGLTSK